MVAGPQSGLTISSAMAGRGEIILTASAATNAIKASKENSSVDLGDDGEGDVS